MIKTIENTLKSLYKPFPRMDKATIKFIADKILWLLIAVLFIKASLGAYNSIYPIFTFADYFSLSNPFSIYAIITAVLFIIQAALLAKSFKPVMQKQRSGWITLVLYSVVAIVSVVYITIISLVSLSLGMTVDALLSVLTVFVSVYVFLELEPEFTK